jgi:SAM-dependent methyltransferase
VAARGQDANYLLRDQYRTDANLAARGNLHQRFSTNRGPGGWFGWLFDRLLAGIPAQADVLELGCGPGWLWQAYTARVPAGWRVTLTDFSPGMVEAARANVTLPSVRFELVDAQHIPYANASFDAVVANHMLYHVPDRPRALQEIHRVLRPGGRLFAATNGDNHMRELDELARRISGNAPGDRASLAFNLENGAAQLEPYFRDTRTERFPDALEVTDADAAVDYVRSAPSIYAFTDAHSAELRRQVQAAIDQRGALHVSKSPGLFTASR